MALRKLEEARAIWEKGNSNSKWTNSVAVLVYPTLRKWLPNSIGVSTYPTNVGGGVMATMGSAQGGLAAAGERVNKRMNERNMLIREGGQVEHKWNTA